MTNPYAIERYKYILEQKKRLNDVTFKIAAFYQTIFLALLAAQFKLLETASTRDTEIELMRIGSWGLFWMLTGVSLICVATLVAGIISWLGYRREETVFEMEIGQEIRPTPSLKNALSWYETYIIIAIIGVSLAHYVTLTRYILPTFL